MRNVRIDQDGQLHCWRCGATSFTEKRTGRSKWATAIMGILTLGIWLLVMVLFTKKKLKCRSCGAYNDVGNAQPLNPPAPQHPPPPTSQPPPPQMPTGSQDAPPLPPPGMPPPH